MVTRLSRLLTASVFCLLGMPVAHAQVLAQDGPRSVTVQDVEAELSTAPAALRAQILSNPQRTRNVVQQILIRRTLADQAAAAGLATDPVVIRQIELARERVLSDVRLRRVDEATRPTAQAIEAYARSTYNADPNRFRAQERVRARHILIRNTEPDAKAKAEQLLAQLKAGADFVQLATTHSQDPGSAPRGGDLGFFERGRMVPQFEQAAFALERPGQITDLVETQFGFHILRLEERKPAGVLAFEEVRDALIAEGEQRLSTRARQELTDQILRSMTVNEQALVDLSRTTR